MINPCVTNKVYQMSYYVYKITNNINSKIYVGVKINRTKSPITDGYMGSGTNIRLAIKKYGVENFTKSIFYITNKEHAYWLESHIVDTEFVSRVDTYNIKTGGTGGGCSPSEETREKLRQCNLGKKASEATKRKMSESNKGISRPKNAEYRKKISDGLKGNTNRRGKPTSEAAKAKIRKARSKQIITEEHKKNIGLAQKGIPHRIVTCPHCNKEGGVTAMSRWHFNNCKTLNDN